MLSIIDDRFVKKLAGQIKKIPAYTDMLESMMYNT
jgi:hypothetical protein